MATLGAQNEILMQGRCAQNSVCGKLFCDHPSPSSLLYRWGSGGRGITCSRQVPGLWVQCSLQDSRLPWWHNLSSLQKWHWCKRVQNQEFMLCQVRQEELTSTGIIPELWYSLSLVGAGSRRALWRSGKLSSSCSAVTKGTLHQAANLSKGRACQLWAFVFSLSQSFSNFIYSLGDLVKASSNSRSPGYQILKHSITCVAFHWRFVGGGGVHRETSHLKTHSLLPSLFPDLLFALCNGEIPSLFRNREVPPTLRAPEVVIAYCEQWRRRFSFGTRDRAWSLKRFCIAEFY